MSGGHRLGAGLLALALGLRRLIGHVELGDLEPGKSGTLPLTLQPGHYVLFCNQPGHFAGGMYAELTVAK